MKKRFVREVQALKQDGTVRPHLSSNGRCKLVHVPSGQTATLILDDKWPWRSPVIEAKNGERFHILDTWTPEWRMVALFPLFFSQPRSFAWVPTHTSECFEP